MSSNEAERLRDCWASLIAPVKALTRNETIYFSFDSRVLGHLYSTVTNHRYPLILERRGRWKTIEELPNLRLQPLQSTFSARSIYGPIGTLIELPRVDFAFKPIYPTQIYPGNPFPVTSNSILVEHELRVKIKLLCIEKQFEIRMEKPMRVLPALYKIKARRLIIAESSSQQVETNNCGEEIVPHSHELPACEDGPPQYEFADR